MSSEVQKTSLLSFSDITPNQQKAIDRLFERDRTLLIAPVGFGKAVVGLTAAQELVGDDVVNRMLVVAPLKVCQLTLATEWQKWEHLKKPALAIGDANARRTAIESDNAVVIINIENLSWFFEEYGDRHEFDGLLIDELTKFKSSGGATYKKLRRRLDAFAWRCGMSATPVAEAGEAIYAQALLLDDGAALGRSKDRFRRRYMYPTDFNQYKWEFQPGGLERVVDAVASLVFYADGDAYEASLPPIRDQVVAVGWPQSLSEAYEQFASEEVLEIGPVTVEAPNAAVVVGKLLQFTAGAVYDESGVAHWQHYHKFEALRRVLADADGPVMIAYQFEFEKDELKAQYPELVVLGDNPEAAQAAWNAGELSLMAVHPKSCAHGLNLAAGGNELVVMTPPWSADAWRQLIGRLCRRGQHRDFVRRTVLMTEGDSVDALVLEYLSGKREREDVFMALLKRKTRR